MSLNPKQERFVREYLIDSNATRAYRAAGYKAKNDNVAAASSSALLRKPKIQARIAELESKVHEKLDITKEKIEREVAAMAFVDIRDFFDDRGAIKPVSLWTREMAAAVASIEVFEEYLGRGDDRVLLGHTKKLKLWPKLDANALLGAAHGLGVKRMEVGHPGDFDKLSRDKKEQRVAALAARHGLKLVPLPGGKQSSS